MLDIAFIRKNKDEVARAINRKKIAVDLEELLSIDARKRVIDNDLGNLRHLRNQLSSEIAMAKDLNEREALMTKAQAIANDVGALETEFRDVDLSFRSLMLKVPNVIADSVPDGLSDEDNVEILRWGEPRKFDFEPKNHIDLLLSHGLINQETPRRYAGSRAYSLFGDAALLELAVIRYALDFVLRKNFIPSLVPLMVREQALFATGYFPFGEENTYSLEKDELYLIGTSEVSIVANYIDALLEEGSLPIRHAGISACFRREAGAAGRDTKGLYRVHQFQKVEQVVLTTADESQSDQEHLNLLANSEQIMQDLELPYRVVAVCTGDLGLGQTKKNDVEAWMPSRNAYGETHSCSSFRDFQARRANICYRDQSGKKQYVYTLNNTAIASPRILIPIIENNQNSDGTITIPKALRPYMNGKVRLEKLST